MGQILFSSTLMERYDPPFQDLKTFHKRLLPTPIHEKQGLNVGFICKKVYRLKYFDILRLKINDISIIIIDIIEEV